jgi:hypothetical protein
MAIAAGAIKDGGNLRRDARVRRNRARFVNGRIGASRTNELQRGEDDCQRNRRPL